MMIDQLSFEDRKLVELARALYTSPKIWIIDETTTALSVAGRELLYKLMKEKRDEGKAILFISHDIEEIMDKCDSLYGIARWLIYSKFTERRIQCR